MSRFKFDKLPRWVVSGGTSLALVAVVVSVTTAFAVAPDTGSKTLGAQLSGAELFAVHCNRCHAERQAPERTPDQWKTILTHMRVRANLPAEQAKAILKYLQANSGI